MRNEIKSTLKQLSLSFLFLIILVISMYALFVYPMVFNVFYGILIFMAFMSGDSKETGSDLE